MGKLSLWVIALGFLVLALSTCVYMDLLAKTTIYEPVAMFFFGTCLASIGKLSDSKAQQ